MIYAKLFVLEQEIDLLWTDMRYVRGEKTFGAERPTTTITGGKITVRFHTREDSDVLLKWMVKGKSDFSSDPENLMEEGKICFYADGLDAPPTKTYEFSDAYLTYYKESFDSRTDENPFQTTITISPAIQNYGIEHIEPWNISYVEPMEDTPYQAAEKVVRPRIYDIYYEDMDGGIVKELKIGTEVNVVIISSDASGKAVDLNLSDKKHDFLYNGDLLQDDILKGLTLSGDTHKEKLTVVAQHHD